MDGARRARKCVVDGPGGLSQVRAAAAYAAKAASIAGLTRSNV